jgi:hypothetical protein
MSSDQRVVLRSSWPSAVAPIAPLLLIFLAIQIMDRSFAGAIAVVIAIGAVVAGARQLQYLALTPEGLEIHWFGMRRVAWQDIGSVEFVDRLGGQQLRIYNIAKKRGRYLPAPRGAFGVGKKETAAARDLIEQWWQAYSGRPLPMAPEPTSPPAAPGGPDDPWRSPPED